jgi:glycosyltransferase involved in cell wall biosynthesis
MNSEKIKNVLLISLFPISSTGGGENYTLNCAKAISIDGDIECYLVAPKEGAFVGDKSRTRFHQIFTKKKLLKGKIVSETSENFKGILHEVCSYDIVFIHQYLAGIAVYDLMSLIHNKQNLILTNLGFEENSEDFWIRYQKLPNHLFLEISDYAAMRSKKYTDNVSYIYGGVWLNQLEKSYSLNKLNKKNNFVSVGRVLPHKSFEVAIDALLPEQQLVIVGPLGDESYIKYLTMKSRSKNVLITGKIISSERDSIINSSLALIANSATNTYSNHKFEHSELLGLVILEALVNNTLPITSSQAALKEVMNVLNLTTFIYPERESSDLRKLMGYVVSLSEEDYLNLIEQAKEIIKAEFLWDDYWLRLKAKIAYI